MSGHKSQVLAGLTSFVVFSLVSFALAVTYTGNDGANYFGGTSDSDVANMQGGPDTALGAGAADTLRGMDGNDAVQGEGGWDSLYGGEGNDDLRSGDGINGMIGDNGEDDIYGTGGGSALNALTGNAGDDFLDARNGVEDQQIDGGAGYDTCFFGQADAPHVSNCEERNPGGNSGGIGPG